MCNATKARDKKESRGSTHPSNNISINDRNAMGLEKIRDSTLSR
jgi:hypothetical protein